MKKILFVCVENSCRSQMAEAFAREIGKGIIEPYSAGSRPSGMVNTQAIEAMREKGIDISSYISKGFEAVSDKRFDIVVTMGCGDICPLVPAKTHIAWPIPDPKGGGPGIFREVRDVIERRVKDLVLGIIAEKDIQ